MDGIYRIYWSYGHFDNRSDGSDWAMDRAYGSKWMDRATRRYCQSRTYWTVGSNRCDRMDGSDRTNRINWANRNDWVHWTYW